MAKGEVDLIIKAKNDASKALDSISASLKNLTDQQIIAGDSATKADGKLAALSVELTKLRTNAQNLQQLANISTVVDKATAALERQRAAVAESNAEQQKLAAQSAQMKARQDELAASLKSANGDLSKQKDAVTQARTALSDMNKEATALSTGQRNAQRSLDAVTKLISTQEAALEKARAKHVALSAAVAETDKPTKRLTTSLQAAEAALTKRQASLDASRQKEEALRGTLTQNAQAQQTNAAATTQATTALKAQQDALTGAQATVSKLAVESSSLAKSQGAVDREMTRAADVTARLQGGLNEAEAEYKQVTAAADQARAVVGKTAAVTTDAGQAAVQAASKLATFAARMKVIQSGSGTSSVTSPTLDAGNLTQTVSALRNAQSIVKATENEFSKAAVSAEDLKNATLAAGEAVKSLGSASTAVTQQKTAIDGAKKSWKDAESEVRRLALAMRETGQPTEALATAFGQAQGQAKLAKTEFQNQQRIGDQLAQTLQKAGVGAGTLSTAETALTGATRSATDTLNRATQASQQLAAQQSNVASTGSRLSSFFSSLAGTGNRVASAMGQATAGIAKLRSGAASAAGPVGSLAGELRSLAAQVAGLYAIKQGIEGIIRTSNSFDAVRAQIGVAFAGDVDKSAKAMEFSLQVARNLRLPLLETAKGYAQLAAAARGTSLEGEGVNKIFVAFAQAARVTRTSTADLDGIFKALTQSISKGKVQAEELRGQLGDRFPGAVQVMAQALGVTTQQLEKMLEKGQLTTDTLVRMSAEVSRRVAPELANALDSPQAKLQAFQNSWTEMQLKLAQSGFLDAIANAAMKLGDALSRPETIAAVDQLGRGLADIVNYVAQMEDPLGTITTIFKTLVGLQVASWAVSIATGLASMVSGLYAIAAAASAAGIALSPILITIGALAAAFALPWLASWAYDNFPAFREGIWSIGTVVQSVGSGMQLAIETALLAIKTAFIGTINEINSLWAGMLAYVGGSAASSLSFLGSDALNGWAAALEKDSKAAAQGATNAWTNGAAEIDAAWARHQERQRARDAQINAEREKYAQEEKKRQDDLAAGPLVGPVKPAGTPTGAGLGTVSGPSTPFKPDTSAEDEKAAKKRAALEKRVADEISSIQARLDTNKANSLDKQIAGVEEKYRSLYEDLRKLGMNESSEQWKQVDALKAQEIQLVKNRAAKAADVQKAKEQREAEKHINDMLALRRDLLEQIKYAESKGDFTTADKLKTQYGELNIKLKEAIANQIAYWGKAGGPNADLAIAKLKAQSDALDNVNNKSILTAQTIGTQLGSSLKSFGDNFLDKIAQTGDVFGSLKDAFQEFAASFLLNIAKMILQQALFNALSTASKAAGGGVFGSVLGAAASAFSAHTGGIAGSPTLNTRSVNPGIFAGAARYHTGGVVGLQPWEVPIIAKRNEEVLTEDDPRHINNIGNSTEGGNSNQGMSNFQIINAIDSASVVQAGLSSPSGVKTMINMVKANKQTFKQILA